MALSIFCKRQRGIEFLGRLAPLSLLFSGARVRYKRLIEVGLGQSGKVLNVFAPSNANKIMVMNSKRFG